MKCRACDSPNRPGARFCQRCSAPLQATCYGCGEPVPGDGELCPACRTEQIQDPVDAEDLFPERSEEVTVVTTAPYELKPAFIGRSDALEELDKAYDDTRDLSELAFVVLIGEPGMGKSRTVREFSRTLKQRDSEARILAGHSDGSGIAYSTFARLLSGRFGIAPGDTPEESREKITAGVGEVLPAARVTEVTHLLAHLMRVPFEDSPVVTPLAETPQQLEARTFIAMRRFLAADASAGPIVLCLENLEQSGPETINLLHYLAAGLASAPVMILGTARETLYQRFPSFGDGDVPLRRIELGPLSDDDAEALLRELCKALDHVPGRIIGHAKKLDGSPRTLFELVRLLLESEVIVRSGSMSWKIDPQALSKTRLPEGYEGIVAERLRVMDEAQRELLEKAAVIGEVFWLDAVVALVRAAGRESDDPDGPTLSEIAAAGDHTRVSVAHTLARLVEHEWVFEVEESNVPGEREYRFVNPILWGLVYDSIDDDKRQGYHQMVARWLELRPEGRGPLAQEDVGRHLELGGETVSAAACYRRAADAARAKFFNEKAIRLYARSLTCLGGSDLAARIHLWHDLGSVYELRGDFEAALGAFERMLRLAWVAASRTKAAVAFNKMGRVWRRKGDLKLALEYLRRGQELFEQAGDARGIAGSYDDIGHVHYLLGNYDDAFEQVTKGLARRGKGGDQRSIAHSLSNLGNIQADRGRFSEALNCHQEALELRRAAGDRAGVVGSLNNLAVLAFEHGDYDEARSGWLQALTEASDIGALPLQALALSNLGELAFQQGHLDEARRRLDEAIQLAEEVDDRRLQVEATRNMALLENSGGNSERARELAEHAYEIASSAGLRDNQGRTLLTLGEVTAGSLFDAEKTEVQPGGEAAPDANDYFQKGVEILREIGNQGELARGLEAYGRYKIEQGDIGAGKDLLREALAIFTRLGVSRSADVERVLQSV